MPQNRRTLKLYFKYELHLFKNSSKMLGVMADAFNPRTQKANTGRNLKFETRLSYIVSFRPVRERVRAHLNNNNNYHHQQ